MKASEFLSHLFERLTNSESGAEIFCADEMEHWPAGARKTLIKTGMLRQAEPTRVIECDGCERACFMPVVVRPTEGRQPAQAFISCDKPEDMGRIPVSASRLERLQMTGGTVAEGVAKLLGIKVAPQMDRGGKRWILGVLTGEEGKGTVTLSIENGTTLSLAEKSLPLVQLLTMDRSGLKADKETLLRVLDGDRRQPKAGVGSPDWRKKQAQAAAKARHSKPGGSRDKQEQIRKIWASGKYTSRDRCAEEESRALDMSLSTARKALRNAPDPHRS